MKTVIRLGFVGLLSLVLVSCSKENALVQTTNQQSAESHISTKIFPFTNQPFETMLGKSQAIFHPGDVVAIYVPYGISNEEITSAKLILRNAADDGELASYELMPSTNEAAAQLNVPLELRDALFMFSSFMIDDSFTGKTIHIVASISGNKIVSEDILENSFTVQP